MRIPIAPPGERDIDSLFGLIAAATYDWESWLGPDGRPLWVNDAVIRITGYTPGECLDMADYPASLFLPADLPRFLQAREDMRAGHPGNDLQLRLAKRDGSIAWVSLSWQAITATDGQPLGTRLSVRNLSLGRSDDPHHQLRRAASRLMHEAMREQRTLPEIYAMVTEHAARTLDVSRVGLWLFDDAHDQLSCANLFSLDSGQHSNGTYLHCADYPAYVAAISSDELLAVHQADTHPALRELLDEYLRPLGVSALLDAPIVRDGRTVGVLCHEHIGPPRQWSPAEATFAETLADFIALAQTSAERQQLRVQTERLASIIENSPYMVTTVLPDGHISYLNSAGRRFLGLPGEGDLLHKQAQSFYSPEQLRFRQEVAVLAALAAGHWSGESALEIPGQGRVPIWHTLIAHRNARGELEYLSSLIQDLREQKQTEAALREREQRLAQLNAELEARVEERTRRLEEVNQNLETFAFSVSHDLKAPLRGIDGYSRLLQEEYRAQLPGEAQQFIDNIRGATERMHELIDDLLAYSRIGRRELSMSHFAARDVIQRILDERRHDLDSGGVQVLLDIGDCALDTDLECFVQVMRNLVDNAVKFSRDTPHPEIRVRCCLTPGHILFSVKDNGCGFDMKYHDRIFNIFQRLHRSEDYPGTGVGLAIVSKAAERLGGRVRAESSPGQGAEFILELPHEH